MNPADRSAPRSLCKILATFTGNLYLVIGSLVFGIITMLVCWLPPRGSWAAAVVRLWARGLLAASGVRVTPHLAPELDPRASYIFLCNHQSMFDIPVLLATSPGPVRMLAKRSLFRIPIFGWGMAAGGFIAVDREDRSSARQSFSQATARLAAGTSVLVFPEGTRSREPTLLPFERGGFLLALKSGLSIVPVGISGTREIQPRGSWSIRPGTAVVRYGGPVRVADYGLRRKRELVSDVRRRVAELAGLELVDGDGDGATGGGEE
ncbi:MAG: 1-acyl-sn-glycerol-3-phosphate acyltransferase [Acidobacteriota bacterium]|nr:1-acyl-sn-glycerol-3-phosphate acyltransferase [Acidobacteriota bacterium]